MLERLSRPILAAGLVLLLAGCGGPTAPASPSPTAPASPTPAAETASAPVSAPPAETAGGQPAFVPAPSETQPPVASPASSETGLPEGSVPPAETTPPLETEPSQEDWTEARGEGLTFGRASGTGGALVVTSVQAGEEGLTLTLAPLPNEADVTAFQEGEDRLPAGSIDYHAEAGALVLQLENVVLSSGDIQGDDWLHDFLRENGLTFPLETPMGAVPGSCPYFEKAAISSDGTNTTLSLLLTEQAQAYRLTSLEAGGLEVSLLLAFQ